MLMHTPGAIPGKTDLTREGVVVVIDDDASVRATLKELFESVGLKVKLYASGSAFLEDRIPDATSCVVLDMKVPEMSGLREELARADVHLPIVFVTGHGDLAVRAMKAGLLDAVFTALEQDRTRRETH